MQQSSVAGESAGNGAELPGEGHLAAGGKQLSCQH